MRLLHNNIMVLPMQSSGITESGIIMPDSFKERASIAKVVSVGSGLKDRPMVIKEGDIVWHIKNVGIEVEQEGVPHFILRDVDCHCRIPKD